MSLFSAAEIEAGLVRTGVPREVAHRRALQLAGPAPTPTVAEAPTPAPRMGKLERAVRRGTGPTEHDLQVAVFAWIFDPSIQAIYPDVALAFAVPNGGHRTVAAAMKLKAEGVRAGVPDIWLPARRAEYVGLVIEMKRPGGTTSPEQMHWLAALARQGWRTALHSTIDGAIAEILAHLARP